MQFIIHGLDPAPFAPLFALSDAELDARAMRRCIVDASPGAPCRVSLEDARVGDEVVLLPYRHHDVATPYRAEGPVFVRRNAARARFVDELPAMLTSRLLSLRAYDVGGMLVTADVVAGNEARALLERQLGAAAYVHVHLARPGCFVCRVDPGTFAA
jgi:hypothetical protein